MVDFTVPSSAPGRYVIVVHCRNCVSGGSTFSAVGDFRVIRPSTLPTTGLGERRFLWLGSLLCLFGALMFIRSRVNTNDELVSEDQGKA